MSAIKRLFLEGFTMVPVGMYIGMYPVFKCYLNSHPRHGEMWYTLVFKTVYRLGQRPLREMKERLFSSLRSQVTSSERPLRILEIGPGFGGNFGYYPENTQLTTVEIKALLENKLEQIQQKYPNLTIVRSVIANAENMKEVESDSFDIVVGTLILCCIEKPRDALKEIQRVLVKGGKFYFMENVSHGEHTLKYKLQRMYKPFWKGFTLGCKAGCFSIKEDMAVARFSKIDGHEMTVKGLPLLLSRFEYGIAIK